MKIEINLFNITHATFLILQKISYYSHNSISIENKLKTIPNYKLVSEIYVNLTNPLSICIL